MGICGSLCKSNPIETNPVPVKDMIDEIAPAGSTPKDYPKTETPLLDVQHILAFQNIDLGDDTSDTSSELDMDALGQLIKSTDSDDSELEGSSDE